jgi:hypothetical protein
VVLQQLDPLWDELFPAEQARIVALLVERVDIGREGLNVRLRVDGLSGALLRKSPDGRGSPFPGQTHPTASVTGMPSAVKPFSTATRTWNSAT